MRSLKQIIFRLLVAVGIMALAVPATAADSKEVNDLMRKAESLYFNGKVQEADSLLKQAEQAAEAVLQGDNQAEKTKVKRLESKLKSVRKNIDRKLGGPPAGAPAATAPQPAPSGTPGAASSGELPSYVASQLKNVGAYLDNAQGELDKGRLSAAKSQMAYAHKLVAQIEERHSKYNVKDNPDMLALKKRKADIEAVIAGLEGQKAEEAARAAGAAAEAKAVSDEWISRLKPYVLGVTQSGHDPERYFIGSYTAEEKEMGRRTAIYSKVKADLAAYKQSGPGEKATDELKDIIKELEHGIRTFNESCASMAQMYLGEAERKIKSVGQRVDDQVKKIGSKDLPLPMSKDAFEDVRRSLDSAAGLLGKDDTRVVALEKEYQGLVEKNGKVIQARVSETRMIPDKFSGGEKGDIKKKAEQILQEKFAGIKPLRTTVISPDWKEESVVEWTDTTHSALRHRVTRSVSAQVSGKLNGDTKLYTLYIGKHRRTDGSWGQLHGHLMFTDPILEENVNK